MKTILFLSFLLIFSISVNAQNDFYAEGLSTSNASRLTTITGSNI